MKLLKIGKLGGLVLLGMALVACTNSSITQVRKSSLPQSNFTFGEVLDGAEGCKSSDWDHSKAEYGQTLVEFTCLIATSDDVVKAARQQSLQDLDRVADEKNERYSKMVAAAEDYLANAKKSLDVMDKVRAEKIEEAARTLKVTQARVTEIVDNPINNPSLKRMAEQDFERFKVTTAELQAKLQGERVEEQARGQDAIDKAQIKLDEIIRWKDRYLAAVKTTREKANDDLDRHFSGSHKFELKVTFLAHETKGVAVNSSEWFMDGKKVAVNTFIPAFLRHPKDMDTALQGMFKDKIRFDSAEEFAKVFPIDCPNDWGDRVMGCAFKS